MERIRRRLARWLIPEAEHPSKKFLDDGTFVMGRGTYHTPVIVDYPNDYAKVVIGNFCSVHGDVEIFRGGNHRIDWAAIYGFKVLAGYPVEQAEAVVSGGDVIIGNDCWIGRTATILSGIRVGDGAVIGAKSVVTKDIGPYEIWAGNPAKFIRKRFSDDQIAAMLRIKWWEWDDDLIKERVLDLNGLSIDKFIEKYDRHR